MLLQILRRFSVKRGRKKRSPFIVWKLGLIIHYLPNFVYQGRTVVSAVCSRKNKHGTYGENGFVNLSKKPAK